MAFEDEHPRDRPPADEHPRDRATVALVAERIESLRELVRAEFRDTQRQLDNLSALPLIVNGLVERVRQHDDQIQAMRAEDARRRDYRIGPLVANLVGIAGVIVAIVAVVVSHGA